MNIISKEENYNNKNIYNHLLEEFLHNMAGKINVFKLMLEMNYSIEDLKKNMIIIEGLLVLYRGILLKRQEIKISSSLILSLFEDRGVTLVFNDLQENFQKKAFLLCVAFNLTSISTTIIFEKKELIFVDTSEENIIMLQKKLKKEMLISHRLLDKNRIVFYLNELY